MEKELSFSFGRNLKESWHLYKKNFWAIVLVYLIFFIVLLAVSSLDEPKAVGLSIQTLSHGSLSLPYLITTIVVFPLVLGIILKFSIQIIGGEKVKLFSKKIKDLIPSLKSYLNLLVATVIYSIIIGLGFALLVIPGLYLMGRLFPFPYLIVDRKMGVFEAFNVSWKMTKKVGWFLFFKQFQVTVFSVLPLLLFIIINLILVLILAKTPLLFLLFFTSIFALLSYLATSFFCFPVGIICLVKLYKEVISKDEEPEIETLTSETFSGQE